MIDDVYYDKNDPNSKKARPAAISELYNNQRKSLNKELLERIATVLDIKDVTKLFKFTDKN